MAAGIEQQWKDVSTQARQVDKSLISVKKKFTLVCMLIVPIDRVVHVLLSISLGFKHAYSLSSRPKRDHFQYHTGSDLCWGWFGFGTETTMHAW